MERFVELQGLLDTEDEWIQKWSKSDRCLNGIAYDEVCLGEGWRDGGVRGKGGGAGALWRPHPSLLA